MKHQPERTLWDFSPRTHDDLWKDREPQIHSPHPVIDSFCSHSTCDNVNSQEALLSRAEEVSRTKGRVREGEQRGRGGAGAGSRFAWEGIREVWGPDPGLGAENAASGASPPWPGLCFLLPSSLRAQVRPPGKGPWRTLVNPLCLCPQGDLRQNRTGCVSPFCWILGSVWELSLLQCLGPQDRQSPSPVLEPAVTRGVITILAGTNSSWAQPPKL